MARRRPVPATAGLCQSNLLTTPNRFDESFITIRHPLPGRDQIQAGRIAVSGIKSSDTPVNQADPHAYQPSRILDFIKSGIFWDGTGTACDFSSRRP